MNTENRKLICAILMYPVAYIYTLLAGDNWMIWLGVFVALYILITECLSAGKARTAESWIWLACLATISVCAVLGHGMVWAPWQSMLFIHALAVWWALSRGGALLDGESGHLILVDAFNGVIRFPFGGFFQRFKCVRQGFKSILSKDGEKKNLVLPAILAAVVLAALLLYWVVSSLAVADDGFGKLVENILEFLRPANEIKFFDFLFRLLLSLPVGAWLFGLLSGSSEADRDKLDSQAQIINGGLARMRIVPAGLWYVCMAVFTLVYILFFAIQGRYLFGAFTRTLPEGFIVSEYARQGFFELCKVMGINFALLWLVTRSSVAPARSSRTMKLLCTLLLTGGILFAIVAISKLGLYISCFGFTPKRLQSTWLAVVLLAGSAAAIYTLWSGKKSFRLWLIFSVLTLSLLHLY